MSSNDIKTLVGKMSLKEKVGQITQILYQGEEPEEFYKVIDKIMPGSLILAGSSLVVVPDYSEKFESFPACYLYENAKGQRFMVYTFAPTYF